jgi:hypothetical protein
MGDKRWAVVVAAVVALASGGAAGAAPWWDRHAGARPDRPSVTSVAGGRRASPIVIEPGPLSLVHGLAANLLPPDGNVVSTKVLRAR